MKSQNIGASVFHIHLSLNCPSCNERIDTKLKKRGSIKKAILTGVALFDHYNSFYMGFSFLNSRDWHGFGQSGLNSDPVYVIFPKLGSDF